MSDYININEREIMHVSMVKRLHPISNNERESLDSLGDHVQADKFSTRIEKSDGTKVYAHNTIDEIADKGVSLVQIDDGSFIPHQNIGKVVTLDSKDRERFRKTTGRDMRADLLTRIETRAGAVLSPLDAPSVMRRMSYPYQPQTSRPGPEVQAEKQNELARQQAAVMSKAAAPKEKKTRTPQREP